MFFTIDKSDNITNNIRYKKKYISYNKMIELLSDSKEIKNKLKNYLKKNKYVKFADNGEDFICLFPNSKFFKKFKDDGTQEDYIREVLKDFLEEELDFYNSNAVDYIDIDMTISDCVEKRSFIKILFL